MSNSQKSKGSKPRLPIIHRDQIGDAVGGEIRNLSDIESLHIKDLNVGDFDFTDAKIESTIIENAKCDAAKAKGASLIDVIVKHSSFANALFDSAQLHRVEIVDARLTGWRVSNGKLTDVTFRNCKANLANFRFCKLTKVIFDNCILSEADFLGAELENVSFNSCDLTNAEFSQTKFKNVDLSGSKLEGARIGIEQLRGTTIDYSQSVYVLQVLGIKIG